MFNLNSDHHCDACVKMYHFLLHTNVFHLSELIRHWLNAAANAPHKVTFLLYKCIQEKNDTKDTMLLLYHYFPKAKLPKFEN